jgi:chorismate synthase
MNTHGRNFRVTTFGESHGPAVGAVIDGCPPLLLLSEADIQPMLDRRRPGKSPLESPRQELDRVEILSGVFEGQTTGTPIALMVRNEGMQSKDYEQLREVYRPGHADRAYEEKYGIRDHRGGGRSSGRETLARVAAGAVAVKVLAGYGVHIAGEILSVHGVTGEEKIREEILRAKAAGDSVGGIIGITAIGCPKGLGDPVFGRLDAGIAAAMMGIGAVKGVEIGEGFNAAALYGSENNDQIDRDSRYSSNHSGGILGGISTGEPISVRIAVKPTPSISTVQQTIDRAGNPVEIQIQGRHDPSIVPRAVFVAEAMLALVLVDALLEQQKYKVR